MPSVRSPWPGLARRRVGTRRRRCRARARSASSMIDERIAEHVHARRERPRRAHRVEPLRERQWSTCAVDRRVRMEQRRQRVDVAIVSRAGVALDECAQLVGRRSQHGDRIDGAPGGAFDAQGRHREQELPPSVVAQRSAIARERHVVDEMQADRGDADLVDRERPVLDRRDRASGPRCRRCRAPRPPARAATAGSRDATRHAVESESASRTIVSCGIRRVNENSPKKKGVVIRTSGRAARPRNFVRRADQP